MSSSAPSLAAAGSLVMSPTPRGKHVGTIRRLRRQLESRLPSGTAAYEVTSVGMPDDPDDYATPDLVLLPDEWDEGDAWLADPADAVLAGEAISQSEKARDIGQKDGWYAVAGVAALLVIDPRHGTWAPYARPESGSYQERSGGKFGEDVPLPEPPALVVATDSFPRYGTGAVG
ncbi:Uma2 family endonuclease [Streptomyces sp. NPDC047939]|uniref:Uma2 family endonuclease n=1 Tax=unclassified Streptomyces TaxID=2593676 RepID=UPI0034422D56